MPAPFTTTLAVDKVTPGTVRFTETDVAEGDRPLSIYLPNETASTVLGPGEVEIGVTAIKLTVERA